MCLDSGCGDTQTAACDAADGEMAQKGCHKMRKQ